MRTACFRLVWVVLTLILFSSVYIFYQKEYPYSILTPPLINHRYPTNFSSLYKNLILLSCSSDSYSSVYCYYLPFIALAWRRIGFEPVIFLVGSDKKFRKMPLMNILENDLQMKYHFVNVDSSRSISASQIIRLFGGFMSYEYNTTKDYFIIMGDADLLPISRHRFQIDTNQSNYILAVNADCCPEEKFSYGNFRSIHYYPMSYVGMKRELWRKLFLPLKHCSISSNITIEMIDCCLTEKMNVTVPRNITKGTKQWDIDQKLLSLLIAQAEHFYGVYVDKRRLGYRLDPNRKFLASEFDSILFYDDVHLPNNQEEIIYSNHTWLILKNAFSNLFNNETIRLLSRYHYQTTTSVLSFRNV